MIASIEMVQRFGRNANIQYLPMAQVFKKLMISNISLEEYKIFDKELLLTNFYRTSSFTGAVKIEEIKDFCQTDLSTKNVALVYSGMVLYVWIGDQSKFIEQKLAIETAMVIIVN